MDERRLRLAAILGGLAVLGFATVLLFVEIGGSLHNTDDVLYAQVIRELAAGGEPLHLSWHGIPFIAKPPLFFWVGGALVRWLGESEVVLRLPALLSALALLGLVYALVYRLTGRAWSAAAIALWLLLSRTFFEFSRRVMLDVPLGAAAFAAMALLCAFPASRLAWFAAGVSGGAAVLIKSVGAGPVLLLPAVYFAAVALRRRHFRELACGAFGVAVVVGPWLLAIRPAGQMAQQTGLGIVTGQAIHTTQFTKPAGFYLDLLWQTEPWYLVATAAGVVLSAVLVSRSRIPHGALLFTVGPSALAILSALSAKLPNYLATPTAAMTLVWVLPLEALASRAPGLVKGLVIVLLLACPVVHLPYLVGNPVLVDPSREMKSLALEVARVAPAGSRLLVVNIYFLAADYYARIPTLMVARQPSVFERVNYVREFQLANSIVKWSYDELGRELAARSPQFALLLTSRYEQHRGELGAVHLLATAGEYSVVTNVATALPSGTSQ